MREWPYKNSYDTSSYPPCYTTIFDTPRCLFTLEGSLALLRPPRNDLGASLCPPSGGLVSQAGMAGMFRIEEVPRLGDEYLTQLDTNMEVGSGFHSRLWRQAKCVLSVWTTLPDLSLFSQYVEGRYRGCDCSENARKCRTQSTVRTRVDLLTSFCPRVLLLTFREQHLPQPAIFTKTLYRVSKTFRVLITRLHTSRFPRPVVRYVSHQYSSLVSLPSRGAPPGAVPRIHTHI